MWLLVKEGHHNRLSMPSIHFGIKYLKFRIKFDENCYYPILDTDDYDLNKGYGWTVGLMVHDDSIRLCWRPDEKYAGKIQLHTYIYNNRVRTMNYMTTVDTGRWYEVEIKVTELLNNIQYTVRDDSGLFLAQTGEKFIMPKFRWGYFLDLFMGGNKPARQDTSLWIKIIEKRR
jgi:hypothetical protein